MTDKNNNINTTKPSSVVQANFRKPSSAGVDWDKYRDREELLQELCEAYSSLEMLASSAQYDSNHPADVMRPLNRLFEQVLDQFKG